MLAVLGLAGSGKSEVVRALVERHGYASVYFGGVIVEAVKEAGLEVTPANERQVRERIRAEEGMAAVARRSIPHIEAHLAAGRAVVADGVYGSDEMRLLHATLACPVVALAVHCPRWLRKERLSHRPVRPLTGDEVDERDLREIEAVDKAPPIVLADHHLVNDGTLDALIADVDAVLKRALAEDPGSVWRHA